jgi:glycosyltransferase involved in cell wall biosynthesis
MAKIPNLIVRNRFISDTEINEILGDSLALVLPYVGGVLQSSFVAIAYGNGCPVIVSNIGSLPEEVENGKTGYVVDKANASDLAEAMTKIYLDSKRAIMTENCVAAYREKFNWDAIGEAIYRDMKTSLSRLRGAVEPRRAVPHEQTEGAQSQGHQPHGD